METRLAEVAGRAGVHTIRQTGEQQTGEVNNGTIAAYILAKQKKQKGVQIQMRLVSAVVSWQQQGLLDYVDNMLGLAG
jgi:hypothetical protein